MNNTSIIKLDRDVPYRNNIINTIIKPDYEYNIKNILYWRKCWSKTANVTETIANLLLIISSLFGTLITIYPNQKIFGILAAILPVLTVALNNFTASSNKKSDKLTMEGNLLLEKLNIETLPEITDDDITFHQSSSTPNNQIEQNPLTINQVVQSTPNNQIEQNPLTIHQTA